MWYQWAVGQANDDFIISFVTGSRGDMPGLATVYRGYSKGPGARTELCHGTVRLSINSRKLAKCAKIFENILIHAPFFKYRMSPNQHRLQR
ncbi:hypothetical protein Tcan_06816 [Toxocara canis]|uniref:Uncharacterized protein n=1 Tax=Toxocara canis TaxID=6265 RepID=A0A0B2VX77_TOXCA|nr:hypothetical protein Tcan_06816 [Toxocara canis]